MRRPVQQRLRDESGFSYVFVGVGMLAFVMTSALAIDVGMFMTARAQAQNSADAGALAGAVALLFDSYTDRSTSGPAVQSALAAATANAVMKESVSITPADVLFLNDPLGQSNRVKVTVYRTAGRANPVATLIGGILGVTNADVRAEATAEAAPANAATCVAPFTIPDKWIEKQTPPWDTDDTFDSDPKKPQDDPDVYPRADQPTYVGYNATTDKGLQLVLKAGTGNNINPSFYQALALPGSSGSDDYRWNIGNCNTSMLHWDDLLTAEPGNMVGPTKQGIEDLIALDPTAYWDTTKNEVHSSMHPSPRVKIVPLYDPYYYDTGKKNGRNADLKAANFIGFFFESIDGGGNVTGRIIPTTGLLDSTHGPSPAGAFARAIRLVE